MTKDKFIDYFTKLQNNSGYISSLWELLNENVCDTLFKITDNQMKLISEIMENEYPYIVDILDWIGWFTCDVDFGKHALEAKLGIEPNITTYIIASVDDFYKFIVDLNEYNKENE